jgi:hypothetical protein
LIQSGASWAVIGPEQERVARDAIALTTTIVVSGTGSAAESSRRANCRFGIPAKLSPILFQSARWGRIKAEIICAMTSKYVIALYELIQLRANMDRCVETFPISGAPRRNARNV